MKTCTKCGEEKLNNCFPLDRTTKDGFYPICNPCKAKINRGYYKKRKSVWKEIIRNYESKNKEKRAAWGKMSHALKIGTITKPNKCEICGKEARLDGHHWKGYSNEFVLDVQWLCRQCHKKVDLISV